MLYSTLFRNVLFPVMEKYQGSSIQKNLEILKKTQWQKKQEIQNLQTKRLKAMIKHAYDHVPYYRRIFNEAHIYPDDIKTTKDLEKIPVLTKDTIRHNLTDLIATNIPKKNILERNSSGSTGAPLKYYIDRDTYSFGWAQTFRCWSWAGYSLGDSYVKITHPRKTVLKKIQDVVMNCTLIPAFQINEMNIQAIVKTIKSSKPVILRGYPSSVYLLSRIIEHEEIKDVKIKSVMTTGDTLLPEFRDSIQKNLNCAIFDAYGGEGTTVAFECEEHHGFHIAEEGVIVEYLNSYGDPSTDDYGELCLTNLTNYAMPLIRYNIQDIGRRSDEMCPCGRELSLLKSIEGRSTDIIVTPGKKLLTIHFFSTFLKNYTGLLQYQIIQEVLDKLTINVVKDDTYQNENTQKIITECKDRIGEEIDIRIEFVNEIPLLKSGKRRFVISKIPLTF
jgi:phenylacetate-CoA ligase